MQNSSITQVEADALLKLEKKSENSEIWTFGSDISSAIPLLSIDNREKFYLDIRRGKFNITKATYQNRARVDIVLARLDLGSAPHRNPNGEEIPSPHLHVYREGFGDKWALPINDQEFPNVDDLWQTLHDFMNFCNIISKPNIQLGLI